MSDTRPTQYRGPRWWSLRELQHAITRLGALRIAAAWVGASALCVFTGILNVVLDWNALGLSLLGLRLDLTIYPPLIIALLLTLWVGPLWGAIPLYLANLASARASGMAWGTGSLFALSGAIEMLIIWGAMTALNVSPALERWRDLRRYLLIGLIAATSSSLAVIIWNATHGSSLLEGQRLWRGWVFGDMLQIGLLAAPILRWGSTPARRWIERQLAAPPETAVSNSLTTLMVTLVFTAIGGLVYLGVDMLTNTLDIAPGLLGASGVEVLPMLREIGFFLGLLFVLALATTAMFAASFAEVGERERNVALRDPVTGCYNRRAFYDMFEREAERSRRNQRGLGLLLLDIDHFKHVNDELGHAAGDTALRQIVVRIQGLIRETDLLFRWGGEEFVVLLPQTDHHDAIRLAERIRQGVAERPLLTTGVPRPVTVTVSLGIAWSDQFPLAFEELIQKADEAVYRAKALGRNRVELSAGVPV